MSVIQRKLIPGYTRRKGLRTPAIGDGLSTEVMPTHTAIKVTDMHQIADESDPPPVCLGWQSDLPLLSLDIS